MGSYCSCSGSFKPGSDIIIPKTYLTEKMDIKMNSPKGKKIHRNKSDKIHRYKTFNKKAKTKRPERKRTVLPCERNSYISSLSFIPHYKVISNSKISSKYIEKLNLLLKPLDDFIPVEQIQLWISDGIEYRGEWNKLRGERHGRGILVFNKEKVYYGYFKDDKMDVFGKQIYCDIGLNEFNNFDIFSENNNHVYYEGEWKNNFQDGKGKEFWPDGTKYEGEYKNGKKSGKGKLNLPDGSLYEGQFKDGEINGKGKIIYNDKRIYEGEWSNNKFNGKGVFLWPDGKKYTGEYLNNLKDGYGIFEWPNGRKYRGQWSKGKQNEEGEIYDPKTDKWIAGKWNMGKKVKCNI